MAAQEREPLHYEGYAHHPTECGGTGRTREAEGPRLTSMFLRNFFAVALCITVVYRDAQRTGGEW